MSPGRLFYLLCHAPLAALRKSSREGGPLNQFIDSRARLAMQAASTQLKPFAFPKPPSTEPAICFLTGKRYWYQTAFCAHSLEKTSARTFNFHFFDDGTFDASLSAEASRLFPSAQLHSASTVLDRLDHHLPSDQFPTLRSHRLVYPHLRKLTDLHCGHASPRLVLDSDLLFFRRPDALLAWLASPTTPIHMLDVADAYGYPSSALTALSSAPIPSLVNVGILGFDSARINWPRLEQHCAALLTRHGSSYYLEQALSALLLAELPPAIRLSSADYRLLPDLCECRRPTAALHHYVAESKRGYFRHAWRHHTAHST